MLTRQIRCILSLLVAILLVGFALGSDVTIGPGDRRSGYDSTDFKSRSIGLEKRTGVPIDLLRVLESPPSGLPPVPIPKDNPVTKPKVTLGRKLFFDRRLSLNGTMSCAMCHIPEQGFTNNELATAVGIEGRTVRRNAPTIYNVAYFSNLFHDGREKKLEHQIWTPMLAFNEMGNPGIGYVIENIRSFPDYAGLFEAAFKGRGPEIDTIGMAIASYERTILSANSPFDKWYYGKDETALSDSAKKGFELFVGKAGCGSCHLIQENYALLTDDTFHNTGLGWKAAYGDDRPDIPVLIAPGIKVRVPKSIVNSVSEISQNDLGRYEVTQDPADRWKYKTPSLRNVSLTAPYMHNGSLSTLTEVVEFYNDGGVANSLLDPLIKPLGLSAEEVEHVVSFLESLTGDNVSELVGDAFAAPIGDTRKN